MKQCIPCGNRVADTEATCPACGEASWLHLEPSVTSYRTPAQPIAFEANDHAVLPEAPEPAHPQAHAHTRSRRR
jgi:hypothetical protein